MTSYPLVFEPILHEKVWGGRRLAPFGKALPDGAVVGESWELADLASTSADGAGGDEARSRIANGPMRGLTLADAVRAQGVNLMGSLRSLDGEEGFPLLLKYLDASENLSVQVHPSPAYAREHPGAKLKTESWYIVSAEPDAVIYKGVHQGVTAAEFESAARAGTLVEQLVHVPVKAGDFHHLPSGTCHALGAGIVVAEIQIPSDTTFRVFDWGRTGRALHLEQAMQCIDFAPPDPADATSADASPRQRLVATEHYIVDRVEHQGGTESEIVNDAPAPAGKPMVWMVVQGEGRIRSGGADAFDPVPVSAGTTVLFPAALEGACASFSRDAVVLEIRFPDRAGD